MRSAQGAAVADDNLPGDRFKSGTEMLHRLQRDDAFAFGRDAKCFELLQVEHLFGDGDDQDLDIVNAQDSAWPIRPAQPAEDRPVTDIMSVADRDQLTFERQRATAKRGVGLAA